VRPSRIFITAAALALLVLLTVSVHAQGTLADYERADTFRSRMERLVYTSEVTPHWIDSSSRFWYRNNIQGGKEFVLVDPEKKSRSPAFNHERLAASLSKATGQNYQATGLPFNSITFINDGGTIRFVVDDVQWTCNLKSYTCTKGARVERAETPRRARPRQRRSRERLSPDKKWIAFIRDYNIFIRSTETSEEFQLSDDGEEAHYYSASISWSPDSKKMVTYYTTRGEETTVYLIESSPKDQMRPTMSSRRYALPGDALTIGKPCIFYVENRPPVKVDDALFKNPYRISGIQWNEDSRQFTFRFQQRGEQLARIIGVDAETGVPRVIIEERSGTFVDRYNSIIEYVNGGDEIIWSSERDGWKHLYLYDARKDILENRITTGEWVVRGIDHIDEEARQIYFRASGREPNQDPYLIHYYRVNFDGTGLMPLTGANGNHTLRFSPDGAYYVDTYSRIDSPPVSELRRTSDGGLVMELGHADIESLLETGWKMPEPFKAKGRDGITDIWGVIYKPTNFDASKKYPVIEKIYAGPHSSFVPKTFSAGRSDHALTELGFIVVQIDGMGTANRSKAFHDVAWKNIADAGFPDRILWMKAAARRYPFMDITRVGIFGHSAGGQNSTGALLFHPEFYKVAVSSCGCHDNRMDKAVWNEQWMGYPVGPHYAEQSNVTNAHKLQGKLLLIVGELDTNVPPQSTLQVVDALIKAGKDFGLLVLPGAGHSSGGAYGERRKRDFFVRHLLHIEPPDWNTVKIQ